MSSKSYTKKAIAARAYLHQQIDNVTNVRSCRIVAPNGTDIGIFSEETNDNGEFDYAIKIDWDAWDKAGQPSIHGIDVDKRRPVEYRRYEPALLTQRVLPDNRENLYEMLAKVGMYENDKFEYMLRTHGRCGQSFLTMERL